MKKTDSISEKPKTHWNGFRQKIELKAERKLKARRKKKSVWFGLRMFGMVGWSVAIPTLIGVGIGLWIDTHITSPYSWTLMLLFVGVILGCFNAWYWIEKESQS